MYNVNIETDIIQTILDHVNRKSDIEGYVYNSLLCDGGISGAEYYHLKDKWLFRNYALNAADKAEKLIEKW